MSSIDALAALGIPASAQVADTAAETTTEQPAEVATTTENNVTEQASAPAANEAAETKAPSFEAGDVSDLSFDEIPAVTRSFTGGGRTQYGIEDIPAPNTDGKKFHGKLVEYKGGDEKAFRRSVQSSATGQNTKAKEAGAPNYYITRTHEVAGKFVGLLVIRTDERPSEAEEAAQAAEANAAE